MAAENEFDILVVNEVHTVFRVKARSTYEAAAKLGSVYKDGEFTETGEVRQRSSTIAKSRMAQPRKAEPEAQQSLPGTVA